MGDLIALEQNVIVSAFAQAGGTDELFERIAEQARSFVPDISTKKGRDAIGSVAAKVSSSKKLAEKYALDLVAEKKAEVKAVDTDRIQFCKKMDALRDEILAPRDAWEQAEEDRIKKHEDSIESIKNNARYYIDTTLVELKQSLASAEQVTVDSSLEEFEQEAKIAKYEAIELLRVAIANREKYEAEQAELERLRKAEQERLQREHEERIAKEAADKATREAEEKAHLESERVEHEQREAAEREARLIAEKEEAELRAQQAATVERQRIEREQASKAESERQAEADRLANVEHMRSINKEILNKLCEIGLDEDQAKAVIKAIAKNEVPHTIIKY